ncbi:unnamed protein product [Calypogeia fissa]
MAYATDSMTIRKGLLDGNLGNSIFRVSGAKLVGVDKYGNRYYEKTENTQFDIGGRCIRIRITTHLRFHPSGMGGRIT